MRELIHCAAARGTSLIEVLVALLILSLGMLGSALLLTHDLRNTRSALWRTQAVTLVSDMSDRIRANAAGRSAYDFGGYGGGPVERGCAPDTLAGAPGNCSSQNLAEDDIARWVSAVRQLLPDGSAGMPSADVRYLAAVTDLYRVTVSWQEPGESAPFSYSAEMQLDGAS